MVKKRILVVDDSPPVRRVLRALLEKEGYEVVCGSDGFEAVKAVRTDSPAMVILDLNMPNMDGFEALSKIRESHPALPVVVFSAHTSEGAEESLEALSRGATAWVSKPTQNEGGSTPLAQLKESLLPQVRALAGRKMPTGKARPRTTAAFSSHRPTTVSEGGIVAIGVSTGGPNALADLMADMPADFSTPILIVQHMPPEYTRSLAQRLDRDSPLHVVEGFQGMHLLPGVAYVAPGGVHMVIESQPNGVRTIDLIDSPPINSCRPAVDPMFESVANAYGRDAIGVVLTGMGADGRDGARILKKRGARILVQDEASSVVWGMPGAVVEAGLQDEVLPLSSFASRLQELTGRGGKRRSA